jgi:uncharacterized cupin superfamily protein
MMKTKRRSRAATGSWELGVGSWELGVGSWDIEICHFVVTRAFMSLDIG